MTLRPITTQRLFALAVLGVVGVLAYILAASIVMRQAAGDTIVASTEEAQSSAVVIVPGARVYDDGRPSQFLRQRLDAAERLYDDEIVDHVLMSGDNRQSHYNEPEAMQQYIVDDGVPASDVTMDFAGFDTWDTCHRANEQFGVTEAIIVTQDRFADRTAALCSAAGIDTQVVALPTQSQWTISRIRSTVRERLASVKAWGDITLKPDAHHGGEFVGLVGSEPS